MTIVVAAFWLRHVLIEPVSTNLAYIRIIPFILGYVWIIARYVKAVKDPENYAVSSSQTMFLFMAFMSIDTKIESYTYSMMSLITLAYVIAIMLIERFEDRIKAHWEANKRA